MHRESIKEAVKHVTAEVAVEIVKRTSRMAGVIYGLGGLGNGYFPGLNGEKTLATAHKEQQIQLAEHSRQFKDVTLTLKGGETLSFIAKVPKGKSFSELVQPDAAFIKAIKELKDGEVLKLSCATTQTQKQDLALSQSRVNEPQPMPLSL